jgi:NTP pyrophosphatase (non-canonical NTP hydrolase)
MPACQLGICDRDNEEDEPMSPAGECETLTVTEVAGQVEELSALRGWADTSLEERALHLMSESGEVAKAVVQLGRPSRTADAAEDGAAKRDHLAEELYDVIWNAVSLARLAGVSLTAAAARKHAHNMTREWAVVEPSTPGVT